MCSKKTVSTSIDDYTEDISNHVKQFPYLYNKKHSQNRPKNKNKADTLIAAKISSTFNSTEQQFTFDDIKSKWNKIKKAYMKTTNSSYYLNNPLQFLDPFLPARQNSIINNVNSSDETLSLDDVERIAENHRMIKNNTNENNTKIGKVTPNVSNIYKKKKDEIDLFESTAIKLVKAAEKQLDALTGPSTKIMEN